MHTAFLTADVKYLGHTRIVFQCARDTYRFLHIRRTLSRTMLTLLTYSLAIILGILSLQLVLHFDGYAACRGLILYRTLLFSLLTDTRSIVFRSQWAGPGDKGSDLPDTDSVETTCVGLPSASSFFA